MSLDVHASSSAPRSRSRSGDGAIGEPLPPVQPLVVAVCLLGATLLLLPRLLTLGTQAFWRDEVATATAATRPLRALAGLLGQTDATAGLYYTLVSLVARISTSEFALRLPSYLAACLAVGLVAVAAHRLAGPGAAFSSAGLLLANPMTWHYSGEARPYALVLAAATVCTVLLLSSLGRRPDRRLVLAYAASSLVLGYLHLIAATLLLAHGLLLLTLPSLRPARRRLVAVLVGVALLLLPLVALGRSQAFQTSWIMLLSSPGQLLDIGRALLGGHVSTLLGLAHILGFVLAALAARHTRRLAGPVWILLSSVAVPVAVVGLAGTQLHVALDRYLLFTLAPAALLAGVGLARVGRLAPVAVLLLAAYTVPQTVVPTLTSSDTAFEDLLAAAQFVARETRPGDGVVYSPDWSRVGFDWYLDEQPTRPDDVGVPVEPPAEERGYLYPPQLPADDLRKAALGRERLWVLGYPGDPWRPVPNVEGELAEALDVNGYAGERQQTFGAAHVELYVRRPTGIG